MNHEKLREIAKKIAKRRWYTVIERPDSPVVDWDGSVPKVNDHFSEIIQTPIKLKGFLFFKNKLMVDMEDHKKINNFILNKRKTDMNFLKELAVKMEKDCDYIRNYSDNLDKDDFNSIKLYFNEYEEKASHFRWVINAAEVFEKIVKESIEKPLKKNFITKYNLELNNIKNEIKKYKILEKSIKVGEFDEIKKYPEILRSINKFLKDFSWMKVFHHQGGHLTYGFLMEELRSTLDVVSKYEENKNFFDDLKFLRYLIFLRTHIAESINTYAGASLKPILEKLANNFGLKYQDITFLRIKELKKMVDNNTLPITIEEIKDRKENGYACINLDGEYYFISGNDLKLLYSFYDEFTNELKKGFTTTDLLKGSIASPGFVRGIAKIITNVNDFDKFQEGDILIANSTTPNYISIMAKASAFLTDEGGITSHAAIVSREFKKPCLVGLNNATKVFKDGDLIEVDADNGIVRKIK